MELNGRRMTRAEVLRHVGQIEQLGGTRHYELSEGRARGVRAVDFELGSGFRFTVLPDRGMDISLATWNGLQLAYQSCTGEVHPAYYDNRGLEFLRSFYGGLLTTCGLTSFGPPVVDDGDALGLHGRIASTPARRVQDLSAWEGDDYVLRLRGVCEEGALYRDKLRMTRTYTARLGGRALTIEDEVENFGYVPAPFTIMYHVNPGFPLLSPTARLHLTSVKCTPRDEVAKPGLGRHLEFESPADGNREQVFFHDMRADADGMASVVLVNRELAGGVALWMRFTADTLPHMTHWKSMGSGHYVLGIEPCNVPCLDRATLRAQGRLPFLQPGEMRKMKVELGVAVGAEIEALLKQTA